MNAVKSTAFDLSRRVPTSGVVWAVAILFLSATPHPANAGLLRKTFNRVAEEEAAHYVERKLVQHEARKLARRKVEKLLAENPELRVAAERRLAAYLERHPGQLNVVQALRREWGLGEDAAHASGSLRTKFNDVATDVADAFSREPRSILDQRVMEAARRGEGKPIMYDLKDPRYKGFEKWSYSERSDSGELSEVHYVRDPKTGKSLDFKFKHHSETGR